MEHETMHGICEVLITAFPLRKTPDLKGRKYLRPLLGGTEAFQRYHFMTRRKALSSFLADLSDLDAEAYEGGETMAHGSDLS